MFILDFQLNVYKVRMHIQISVSVSILGSSRKILSFFSVDVILQRGKSRFLDAACVHVIALSATLFTVHLHVTISC